MIRWWRWRTLPARLEFMLRLSDQLNPALKPRSANHCLRNSDGTSILRKSSIKIAESSFRSNRTYSDALSWFSSHYVEDSKTTFFFCRSTLYLTETANNPEVKKYSQINLKPNLRDRPQTARRHLKGVRIQMCTWCFSFSVVLIHFQTILQFWCPGCDDRSSGLSEARCLDNGPCQKRA